MSTTHTYDFLDEIAKVIEPMYDEINNKNFTSSATTSSKEFIAEIDQYLAPMMEIGRKIAHQYFLEEKHTTEELAKHFKRKMFNERMNMVEIADRISKLDISEDPTQCVLLAKQVLDEANHFRMVKEVVEYYNNGPVDVEKEQIQFGQKEPGKGAALIEKYGAKNDPLIMALYQYLIEGRASVLWSTMGEIVPDEFVAKRYAKIGRDEKFHQNIGRLELERLCTTQEVQDRVRALLPEIIWDMWEATCMGNTMPSEELKSYMITSYGKPTRELCFQM